MIRINPIQMHLAGLGQDPTAEMTASSTFDELMKITATIKFENETFVSNPIAMRKQFAESTQYPATPNFGDYRFQPTGEQIEAWIREAESKVTKGRGNLVDTIRNNKDVPQVIKDLLAKIGKDWPDRMVYSPAQNTAVDSGAWSDAYSGTQIMGEVAAGAVNAIAGALGVNLDPRQLFRALISAVFWMGDYVRETYKAWREAAIRKATLERRTKVTAAYKASFGFEPSFTTEKAWGNHADVRALPDGTTSKYLDDLAEYNRQMAILAKMDYFAKLTGAAEANARVGIMFLQNLAQAFSPGDFKVILEALLKGSYNGQSTMVVKIQNPIGAQDNLAFEQEVPGANNYFTPAWENTVAGNFNWKPRDANARKFLAQWTMGTFASVANELPRERPFNLRRFKNIGNLRAIRQVVNDSIRPVWDPLHKAGIQARGNPNDGLGYAYDNLRAMYSHTGGGGPPGEPMAKVAIKLALNRWAAPVAPVKPKPTRCPGGGNGCLPSKQIVGRLPVGATQLPPMPKTPKAMTPAERTSFIGQLRAAGYPDYYIEAILLNPADWYEGASSSGGLAGLGEDVPFYKQTWYWVAVAGVVGVIAYRKYAR